MKNSFISALLLLLFVTACQKDTAIGPSDLLYQRWHLDRVKRIGDSAWISYDTDGYYDTEYRPDGTLIHRKDGVIKPTSCCEAGRYERSGVTIDYVDFPSCPSVRCSSASTSVVTILAPDLLELTDGQRIAQYRPVK
ncbi:hypothetical protein [Spirosoma spitsbergense]|uniref:hypothetical protein n=1 Tax=Spirosoma spitsbergense TaxID=431554 RepID=UPI000375246E|nr:hypothetical protein [Spirosoma spitsbergense]